MHIVFVAGELCAECYAVFGIVYIGQSPKCNRIALFTCYVLVNLKLLLYKVAVSLNVLRFTLQINIQCYSVRFKCGFQL